jgi:cell division protein FtsQ
MIGAVRKRNRRREAQQPSRLAAVPWKRILTAAGVLGIVTGGAGAIVWALDQPIETVAVQGSFQRVSALDVEKAVKERVRGAGLVTVDLETVQRAIEQLPWVDGVTVERAWPRGLRVTVAEQVAAARWGANGLLNARGELFMSEVRHIPPELPKLSGPPGSENAVAQRYLGIQGRLVEAGTRITALRLDPRGSWEIDLDNGVTVRLGRRQVDERFERFVVAALRLVAQRAGDIAYVDMRYTNGFAVGWRGGARATRVASAPVTAEDSPDA